MKATLIAHTTPRSLEDMPAVEPIRLGAIGLGHRGASVLRLATGCEEYQLEAVCDQRQNLIDRAKQWATDDFGLNVRGYTNAAEMIANESLDAVLVTIPPHEQIPVCCAAMEAGLDVMAEVPVAYSFEHCWQVVLTAERTGRLFLLLEQVRFSGIARTWRDIVAKGVIGQPVFAEGEYFGEKTDPWFTNPQGLHYTPAQAAGASDASLAWRGQVPPITYLPHELSPLLYIMDDRVTRVTGMSTTTPSHRYDNLPLPDVQAALMQTQKDAVMRMATCWTSPSVPRGPMVTHWWHIKGTEGVLEAPRSPGDKSKLWVGGWHTREPVELDLGTQNLRGPAAAASTGHGGLDYYPLAQFADALRRDVAPELDVYRAVETAAPAIAAAMSIAQGNQPIDVPDFRPGPHRRAGEPPANFAD
ncbi:Gfo/Idh/MocA family protein [Phycisphaerales bacterium AB-hyl4]|uniref:Gfo/Idh/MocA family protein n=1 Tax=Natronomicrosphaera hydrolytica TaxID=3242702 RepID=A0ABV4U7I8_9BACT